MLFRSVTFADGTDTLIQLPIRSNLDLFKLEMNGDVTNIEIDPGYYILKQLRSNTQVHNLPTNDLFVRCDKHIRRKQDLSVTFTSETERNCHVKLTDANGGKVFTEMTVKQKKEITIPMEQLPNTTYLLYVQNGKGLYVRKIVKTAY